MEYFLIIWVFKYKQFLKYVLNTFIHFFSQRKILIFQFAAYFKYKLHFMVNCFICVLICKWYILYHLYSAVSFSL